MVCVGPFELPRASTSDEIEGFAHLLAKEKDASIPIAHRPYQVASAFFAALYMYVVQPQPARSRGAVTHALLAIGLIDVCAITGPTNRLSLCMKAACHAPPRAWLDRMRHRTCLDRSILPVHCRYGRNLRVVPLSNPVYIIIKSGTSKENNSTTSSTRGGAARIWQ